MSDDARAWSELLTRQVRANGRLFFRVAYGVVRDAAAAEDACQQAFLKAWSENGQIKDPSRLRAWLVSTVATESLQIVRRKQIEKRVISQHGASLRLVADHPEGQLTLRNALLGALAEVEEDIRVVVVMRVMDGFSGKEVSELLGCSAATVSERLHQGLERLRGLLGEWRDAESGST